MCEQDLFKNTGKFVLAIYQQFTGMRRRNITSNIT